MSIHIPIVPLLQGATLTAPPPPPLPGVQPAYSPDGVPLTAEAVSAMRNTRGELSDQLVSAAGRREDLAEELANASAGQRPQLEARIKQLDDRILAIETEIARTGALIARAPGQYLADSDTPILGPLTGLQSPNMTAIGIVLTIFVLAPIALSMSRLIWRRGSNPARPVVDQEQNERLRRLEGNVDAIALEIERISEGQRFVTKLLAEKERSRLEAGRD
jgi:hypothetical protein